MAKTNHTFGSFDPNSDKIWLYVKNRNMADLLRTLAHELVHRKQAEDGRIDYNSGETGSEIENEANAQAGVLLRKFGKQNEEIYQ
jgi:Zn-dependent peptidase ImmA (M78 family)